LLASLDFTHLEIDVTTFPVDEEPRSVRYVVIALNYESHGIEAIYRAGAIVGFERISQSTTPRVGPDLVARKFDIVIDGGSYAIYHIVIAIVRMVHDGDDRARPSRLRVILYFEPIALDSHGLWVKR
jgi:hypothetical protein